MAHSDWLISPPVHKQDRAGALAAKQPAGPAGAGASHAASQRFASFMQALPQAENSRGQASGSTDKPAQEAIPPKVQPPMVNAGLPLAGRAPQVIGGGSTLQLRNPVLAGRSPSELMRAQVFNKAQLDIQQTQAIDGMMQNMGGGNSPLELGRGMNMARHLRGMTGPLGNVFAGQLGELKPSDFIHTRPTGKARPKPAPKTADGEDSGPGRLCAHFESGKDGIAAIGYDRKGGTSYGKYQIASRVGSMEKFLDFLDGEAPDIAQRLRGAGPANTGSRRGAMPREWKAIAAEQPERFEDLQEAFIRESHYKPALEGITASTGLKAEALSAAMKEVIWSMAVQHGPAGAQRLFERADARSGDPQEAGYERKLISHLYDLRGGQFGSSTPEVRQSVQNRFKREKVLALNMLGHDSLSALA